MDFDPNIGQSYFFNVVTGETRCLNGEHDNCSNLLRTAARNLVIFLTFTHTRGSGIKTIT